MEWAKLLRRTLEALQPPKTISQAISSETSDPSCSAVGESAR